MLQDYVRRILTSPVYDVAIRSPLEHAPSFSQRTGRKVFFKREDLQPVFSFKLRGAYVKISKLSETARQRGVIAASAGNHAQGVALASRKLGIKAVIVMPSTTPEIKVRAVQSYGATVVLHGDSYDDAYIHSREMEKEKGLTFIHPYDDPDIIAGQGTVGMEILAQHPDAIEAIFVPVGGGGLVAGIAAFVKFARPKIKIIGVEPDDADCLAQAMKADRRVSLPHVGLFADGVAVRQVGEETFRIAREHVDSVIRVSVDDMCSAIKDIFTDTRSVSEPAGALGVAGIRKYAATHPADARNKSLIAVLSGANMNFDRLRHIAERTSIGENREVLLAVTLPEKAGSLLRFCKILGKRSITEFNYRFFTDDAAQIFVGIQVQDAATDRDTLIKKLKSENFAVRDLTDNDLAKDHIRHIVGGHAPSIGNEVVWRFEFPERPGALATFLGAMNQDWNITLFHYRNHGAAYGRVLMGIQVPKDQLGKFEGFINEFINERGFSAWNETTNPAYKIFVR